MLVVRQSLLVVSSSILALIWQNTGLSQYTVQAMGFLIFLYILVSARNKWRVSVGGEIGIFVLNSIILLLIFQTGGLSSPLFLLLFFILFGAAVVIEPALVFLLAGSWAIVFLPFISEGGTAPNILKLGSLALVSPLSYIFGKVYNKQGKISQKVSDMKERSKEAADTISKDVEEVLSEEKDKMDESQVQKLNEILEETEDLREESK